MKIAAALLSVAFLVGCSSTRDVANADIVADLTKGVSNICPIHHKRMKKTAASLIFSFPHVSRLPALAEYEKAQKLLFPFGETVYTTTDRNFPSHGSVDGPDQVWLYVCEDCRAVGDTWRDEWRYGKKKD
jgi:hypothetical protein